MAKFTFEDFATALKDCGLLIEASASDVAIEAITYNSKEVTPGTLFVCKGVNFKAQYLDDAIASGAVAYISEKKYDIDSPVPYILVSDIRKTMSFIASMFYEKPWDELTVIGIGGTKGKSTSAYYMKAVIDDYMAGTGGKESAIISGIDIYDGKQSYESHLTTPEAMELQQHFRNALDSGITYAQMEISSQALKTGRVDDMIFDATIFQNISADHISQIEHPTFEDYLNSKMLMFAKSKLCAVNLDGCGEYEETVLEAAKDAGRIVTFSTSRQEADYYAYNLTKAGIGIKFMVKGPDFDEEFEITMPGMFNVDNALGIIAVASELGIPAEYIHSGLYRARSKGRMELYTSKDEELIAIVDYAHNKLSFEKLYSAMKAEYPDYDIVAMFGCPGKKSLNRREELGTIAGQYSKLVYIIAEDPGLEPYIDIAEDIAQYVAKTGCPYKLIEDRGEAIADAIRTAEGKTLFLITGKGRETRQKYGNEYLPCETDVDYVLRYLAEYDAK